MSKFKFVLFTTAISTLLVFSACGGGSKSSDPDPHVDWKTGSVSSYPVSSGSSVTITDSLTGIDFEFPEGGSGDLSIARIEAGPSAPYDGEGFSLNYSGSDKIEARISKDGAYCVLLMGYGTCDGSRDNRNEDDWRAIAEIESTASEAVFELQPLIPAKSGFAKPADHDGFTYHWLTKIPAGSSDAVKLAALKNQATEFINNYLDSLPASIQATARAAVSGSMAPRFYADDDYYIGFTRRWLIGNSTTPMIGMVPNAGYGTVAHEIGHYMNHVLVGDAIYLQIEDSAPDNHGLGDIHYMRTTIAEDMAYFSQYFEIGSVNSTDATEPGLLLKGRDPELNDYPSYEGFACCLLARLNSTNSQIRDVEDLSTQRDVPVVGASFPDLFGIIAQGAVNVNQLRDNIKDYLTAKGQVDKFPVILERLGWRYNAKAKIVNEDGDPVVNATVKCVCKVGSTEYFSRTNNGYTQSNGETSYIEIFPYNSYLRVEYNQKTFDFPIYADPNGATHVPVDLGTLEINSLDLSQFKHYDLRTYVRGKVHTHSTYYPDDEHWTDISFSEGYSLHGSFSGNTFTAVWDTTLYAGSVKSVGTFTIMVDPQSKSMVGALAEFIQPASMGSIAKEYSVTYGPISSAENWDDNRIHFIVEGQAACQIISELNFRTYPDGDDDWYELLEFECNEESVVEITLTTY